MSRRKGEKPRPKIVPSAVMPEPVVGMKIRSTGRAKNVWEIERTGIAIRLVCISGSESTLGLVLAMTIDQFARVLRNGHAEIIDGG